VIPAASVNTLIMASVSTAAIRVRRAMTYHLAQIRDPEKRQSVSRGLRGQGTMELITQTGLERTSGR
jgi:hypothetical protein